MKAAKIEHSQRSEPKNDLIAQKRYSTLGGSITDQIETQIVEGQLKPGEKLDEVLLGNQLSVSRTPIREALRVLAAKGLVEFRPASALSSPVRLSAMSWTF
ncbi:GntR family transcriptional regulator [Ochrobactrum tritici]|uniref:GntR family transcriptional regulator n=1 Tax=Brucella tritici TaxID=94626 RepID=A0A7X6J9S0_9HYPH|nr:GntR family transcriptional regulator [Brucella tritici]